MKNTNNGRETGLSVGSYLFVVSFSIAFNYITVCLSGLEKRTNFLLTKVVRFVE